MTLFSFPMHVLQIEYSIGFLAVADQAFAHLLMTLLHLFDVFHVICHSLDGSGLRFCFGLVFALCFQAHAAIAFVARGVDLFGFDGGANGATRLVQMLAIVEAAGRFQPHEFGEALR